MDFDGGGAAAILGGDSGAGADAGAGDTGAAATAGAAAGGEAGAGGDAGAGAVGGGEADPDWYGKLGAETAEGETASNLDYVKAKGFKDLDGLVKAYRSAEKGLHDSGRIKVPGEGASDAEVAAYRTAIGVPEKPDGYQVTLPETNGGLELNTDLVGKLAEIAHKAGVPKAGFEEIANAFVAQQVEDHIAMVQKNDADATAKLSEWGAQKDAKVADCQAAMRALGWDRMKIAAIQNAIGVGETMDMLAKIGGGIAEDTLITGGTGRFGVSAGEAQKEIDAIKANPDMYAKVAQAGSQENARWNRLLAVVAAEEARKNRA